MHVAGALHIVKASGGVDALGLDGMQRFLLAGCIQDKRLLDSAPDIEITGNTKFLDDLGL